ncbi:MAG: FliH/SctL family protein [Myxococcota bacterium]
MSSFEPWPLVRKDGSFEPRALREADRSFRPSGPSAPAAGPEPAVAGGAPAETLAPTPEPSVEELQQRAFEEGREAGRAELPWTDAEALRTARSALERSAAELDRARSATLSSQQSAVVELALAVAEQLVGQRLASDPSLLMGVVERALSRLDGSEPSRVALSPDDLATLRRDREEDLALLAERGVRLEADPGLAAGDVVVRAGALQVDARIREVLDALRAELAGEVAHTDTPEEVVG